MKTFLPATLRQALIGLALVVVSLPVLFLLHRTLKLGNPPVFGLIVLAVTVVVAMAIGGAVGVGVGSARGNWIVAALLGLGVGIAACTLVAPLYGGLILDNLTREATGAVLGLEGTPEEFARERAKGVATDALTAAREGRLRQELGRLQEQAKSAVTPAAREQIQEKIKEVSRQLVQNGKDKGVSLIKSGAAQLSAFALLIWALFGPPIGAAWECRKAR